MVIPSLSCDELDEDVPRPPTETPCCIIVRISWHAAAYPAL